MVLSNKKLKRKLRIAKAESISAGSDPIKEPSAYNPENPNLQLQQLLDAAAKQKPRLSKREIKRTNQPLQGLNSEKKKPDGENGEENKNVNEKGEVEKADGESGDGKKKRKEKKRKREEGESEEKSGLEEDGVLKEPKKAKQKKKQKKQKKKKRQKSKAQSEGGNVGVEGMQEIAESQLNEDIVTRVYVGGIPYYSAEDDIRSFFEGCGTITEVDCMKFPDSGKFRGIAILSFKTEAAAKRALALDGADMGGFYLKVQPYRTRANKVPDFAPKIVAGYNRIYVGNLSWDITEDDLRKFFSDCDISSIRFGMDKDTGEFRGYGHVDFSDNLSLTMALKLDQQIVCGRPIKISCAVPLKGGKMQSTAVSASKEVPASKETNNGELTISSGKIKRRTCYECGEKGHISSACPKKQTADPTTSNAS